MDALDTLKMAYPKTTKKTPAELKAMRHSSDRLSQHYEDHPIATQPGQSLWLDNIYARSAQTMARSNGILTNCRDRLTSNPTL